MQHKMTPQAKLAALERIERNHALNAASRIQRVIDQLEREARRALSPPAPLSFAGVVFASERLWRVAA